MKKLHIEYLITRDEIRELTNPILEHKVEGVSAECLSPTMIAFCDPYERGEKSVDERVWNKPRDDMGIQGVLYNDALPKDVDRFPFLDGKRLPRETEVRLLIVRSATPFEAYVSQWYSEREQKGKDFLSSASASESRDARDFNYNRGQFKP